jgi:hypothetical protein
VPDGEAGVGAGDEQRVVQPDAPAARRPADLQGDDAADDQPEPEADEDAIEATRATKA